ncbi:unnamed protein product [Ranitomeya imitator]|uniref:Uncharacterized protein n=1 Tax=Ranitomeya imitator TaxID=111125 RepID=A0ABN9LID0_9NEOB|nr:unnamed protein product [Ranitomeya imitator]
MIPGLPPYNMDDQLLPMESRSRWGCWFWTIFVTGANFLAFLANSIILAVIFTIVLTPTIVVVYFGFKCHSRAHRGALHQSRGAGIGRYSTSDAVSLISVYDATGSKSMDSDTATTTIVTREGINARSRCRMIAV